MKSFEKQSDIYKKRLETHLKYKTRESAKDIRQFVGDYIGVETQKRRIILPSGKRIISEADIENILKEALDKIDELALELTKYGRTNNKLPYQYMNRHYDMKKLLDSSIGNTVIALNNRYAKHVSEIYEINYEYIFDEQYIDLDISGHFGADYILEFVIMIVEAIVYELSSKIDSNTIMDIITDTLMPLDNSELQGEIEYFYYCNGYSIKKIVRAINPSLLFSILDYDFKDRSFWPYKNNLLDLLNIKLSKFNIDKNTLLKMQLLEVDKYNNIELNTALHIMIFRSIVKYIMNKLEQV